MSISDFIQGLIIGSSLIIAIGPQNLYVINLDKLTWNKYLSKFEDFSYFQSFEYGEYFNEIGWKVFRVIVEEDNKIRLLAQIFFKKRSQQIRKSTDNCY